MNALYMSCIYSFILFPFSACVTVGFPSEELIKPGQQQASESLQAQYTYQTLHSLPAYARQHAIKHYK